MIRILILLTASILFMSNLAQALPKPATSEYFTTVGGGFGAEKGKGLYYGMNYKVSKTIETTLYGRVTFQNPSDKKNPYIVDLVVNPGDEKVIVQSPMFKRIKNNKNYRVEFELFESEKRLKRINRHVDKVNFSLPAAIAMQMGIELL